MRRKLEMTRLELKLPLSLRARIDAHLFSDLEQRIPKGAYQEFFERLAREYFTQLEKRTQENVLS